MKFCSACGTSMTDEAVYCAKCGKKVEENELENKEIDTSKVRQKCSKSSVEEGFFCKYFSPSVLFLTRGRRNRKPYNIISLGLMLVTMIISLFVGIFFSAIADNVDVGTGAMVFCLLLFIVPNYANMVLRLHDINLSGWCAIVGPALCMIGEISGLMLLDQIGISCNYALGIGLMVIKGTTGKNRYGEDPLY